MTSRRDVLRGLATTGAATVLGPIAMGPTLAAADSPAAKGLWDAGAVAHLLPTVNHERMLLKASIVQMRNETTGSSNLGGAIGPSARYRWSCWILFIRVRGGPVAAATAWRCSHGLVILKASSAPMRRLYPATFYAV